MKKILSLLLIVFLTGCQSKLKLEDVMEQNKMHYSFAPGYYSYKLSYETNYNYLYVDISGNVIQEIHSNKNVNLKLVSLYFDEFEMNFDSLLKFYEKKGSVVTTNNKTNFVCNDESKTYVGSNTYKIFAPSFMIKPESVGAVKYFAENNMYEATYNFSDNKIDLGYAGEIPLNYYKFRDLFGAFPPFGPETLVYATKEMTVLKNNFIQQQNTITEIYNPIIKETIAKVDIKIEKINRFTIDNSINYPNVISKYADGYEDFDYFLRLYKIIPAFTDPSWSQ